MIGKIVKCYTQFYDTRTRRMSFKGRPALVIAQADADDFVILPVSTVTIKSNLHPEYDIEIDPSVYPGSSLNKVSYVRTHKQMIAHSRELSGEICDLRNAYPQLYANILAKRKQFSCEIDIMAMSGK